MTSSPNPTVPRKPLRLWPAIAAALFLWIARFGVKAVVPGFKVFAWAVQASFVGLAIILLWWLFFSRAAWLERLGAVVLMVVSLGGAWYLRHESMGPAWFFAWAVPILALAFVAWAVATRRLPDRTRRLTMVATLLLAGMGWTLVRMEGISGDHVATYRFRWSPTAEEKLLARGAAPPVAPPVAPPAAPSVAPASVSPAPPAPLPTDTAGPKPAASTPPPAPSASPSPKEAPRPPSRLAEWPGFRGPRRDGVIPNVRIATDWAAHPPVEIWRRPVGPGWSSFAVDGDVFYTQEQRREEEVVACYRLATGEPVWAHRDAARFFEANGGPGPRATPTLRDGRVYTLGATGILNALEARDGSRVWSRNIAADTATAVPYWGFSSSPVVVDDVVIVAAAGQLVAYDRATGAPRWKGPKRGGYSSPHLLTIDGVEQVVLVSNKGATGVAPRDGAVLWEHPWPGSPIVQPALVAGGDLLVSASAESGVRRLAVDRAPAGWTAAERWTSLDLKPYFNDFVIHEGHAYGFDARILAAIDLADGKRKWKGGRYGNGQLVLLPEQDLLLVLAEEGDLALVSATPDRFTELAKMPALEGKTWNHPVVVGDVLLVRNGEEMAAFRLPRAES